MTKVTDLNQNQLPDEGSSLGLARGSLHNECISASSYLDGSCQPSQGRLQNKAKGDAKSGAWCSKHLDKNQYFQVDFGQVTQVGAIATQGRPDYDVDGGWFVQTYTIAFSNDGENWNTYKEFGIPKVFEANKDFDSIVVNHFKVPVTGRFLRVKPVTWNNHIALRVEFYRQTKSHPSSSKGRGPTKRPTDAAQVNRPGDIHQRGGIGRGPRNVVDGVSSIQIVTRNGDIRSPTTIEPSTNGSLLKDKQNPRQTSKGSNLNSRQTAPEKVDFVAVTTGSQSVQPRTSHLNPAVENDEVDGVTYSKAIKQASATVTSAEGERYIGRIKLIKKEPDSEPPSEVKIIKTEVDCEISAIVQQRVRDMNSGKIEESEDNRKSIILDEEINYTNEMEAKVNERVEMFREAEKQKKEREEAERREAERKSVEKLRRLEEAKKKMQESPNNSPTHSDTGKSDVSDGSLPSSTGVAENRATSKIKAENGVLGASWENLSLDGQDEEHVSVEFEQKLESIQSEHMGYDPEKEREILEQTEAAFRTYATQGKQSPSKRPQGVKTNMLIKSFSVAQDSSQKPASVKRQLSEPRTPSKSVEVSSSDIVPVTAIDSECAAEDVLTSSQSPYHEEMQDIEVGFVRKAKAKINVTVNSTSTESRQMSPDFEEVIESPQTEVLAESSPLMDEIVEQTFMETVESSPVEIASPRSVSEQSSESDLKDIESGLVRRVQLQFKETKSDSGSAPVPPKVKPKRAPETTKVPDLKERSGSSASEASETHISESMSLEFILKEITETQIRLQAAERLVTIAKERLEQSQGSTQGSEAVEAEEEYHETCLELSRLKKRLMRLQKEAKEAGHDTEIDFKGLDRSGAGLVIPTLKSDRESAKFSKECKAPPVKQPPPVDTSVFNDEGECVPEGNVLSQIKAFERMKAKNY